MNTKELSEQLDNLPKDLKKPILAIIDHETEVKMEKVLSRFDTIQNKFENKFNAIQSEIRSIKDSMQSIESKFESKFSAIESKFSILLWVISAIGLMIAIFKFIGYN